MVPVRHVQTHDHTGTHGAQNISQAEGWPLCDSWSTPPGDVGCH